MKLLDFTPEEIRYLLNLAAELKAEKYDGTAGHFPQGILFEHFLEIGKHR